MISEAQKVELFGEVWDAGEAHTIVPLGGEITFDNLQLKIQQAMETKEYGKVVRRSSKLHAHDEQNVAGVGDVVRIVETRPLSATKHWRLLEVLAKAK